MATEKSQEKSQKQRSCLYGLGWIKQKGEWFAEFRKFAGFPRIDKAEMDLRMREQISSGFAYIDKDCNRVDEAHAAYIRLDTGVIASAEITGDEPRFVVIKFHRNQYDLWTGLDFEFGDVAKLEFQGEGDKEKSDPLLADIYWEERWKGELADLAVEEPWWNEYGPWGMLLPYLRYTYRRLKQENKVVDSGDGEWRIFNTGLVSRLQLDPIVAVCKQNAGHRQPWVFDHFMVWAEYDVPRRDKLLMKRFDGVPRRVDWFGQLEKPILEPSCVDMEVSHFKEGFRESIITEMLPALAEMDDNRKALANANSLLKMERANIAGEAEMRIRVYNEIVELLGGTEVAAESACELLQDALMLAKKRLEWEVGTAVPMWDASAHGDVFNFMLPLSFNEDPLKADIAVVMESIDGKYRPKSLLKLKHAYSNARLLCRPDASWLRDYIEHCGERKNDAETLKEDGEAYW